MHSHSINNDIYAIILHIFKYCTNLYIEINISQFKQAKQDELKKIQNIRKFLKALFKSIDFPNLYIYRLYSHKLKLDLTLS